jgi:hypothetical protein
MFHPTQAILMRFPKFSVSKSRHAQHLARRSSRRRFAVQNLEKRELLAGDLSFAATSNEPYRVIEGQALTGRIAIDEPATTDLVIQLELEQNS